MQETQFDQIAGRLRRMSQDGGSIEAAQVKLIGLEEIREAAGPRWPRMRERVRTGSLAILSKFCGPDDVLIPAGDGFLIVLAEGPAGSAQKRCREMRDALLAFYLGEEALKSLQPAVSSRALSADGLSDLIASAITRADDGAHTGPARARAGEIAEIKVYVLQDEQIGAHLYSPVVNERGQPRAAYNPDYILDGRHHLHRDFFDLDLAILDEAITHATAARDAGQMGAVGLTVHASTLQHRRAREAYLSWLSSVDADIRRRLFVSVAEIEKGTPLISIAEWASMLRAHVSRIWLELHYTDHAIASIGGAGASGAGFHLPIYSGAQKGPRAQRMRDQIKFWARTIRGQGMRLVVSGYQEADFLGEASGLGVDFLMSDAHWPFRFTSEHPRRTH